MTKAPWLLALAFLCAGDVAAQSGASEPLKFDVASVKRNRSSDTAINLQIQPGGRFAATNFPLKQFIRAAYTLQLYQIVDAPSWVDTERFDIIATSERELKVEGGAWNPNASYMPVQLMMQSVLADRFRMVAHMEEREAQGYGLVLDKAGDRSKLAPAKDPCEAKCGMFPGPGRLTARNVPMLALAEFLSQVTGRLVIDASELTGNVDLDLRWTPEGQAQADSDVPSIFAALPEQLGLRLEPRRAPLKVLVVDSIDRPTPD